MEINITENGATVTLEMKGHLDTRTAKEADEVFRREAESHDKIVLDMAEVDYLSSAGIRALRSLYMTMYKKGGSLRVENVQEVVESVLEMTGLLDLLLMEKKE